jgi:hypothetical protein
MKRAVVSVALVVTVSAGCLAAIGIRGAERERMGSDAIRLMQDYRGIVSDIRTPKDARSVEAQERMLRELARESVERYDHEVLQTGTGRERTRARFVEQRELFQHECARFDELLTKTAPLRPKR